MDEVFGAIQGVYDPDVFLVGVEVAGFFQDEAGLGKEASAALAQKGFSRTVNIGDGVTGGLVFGVATGEGLGLCAQIRAYFSEEVFQRLSRNHQSVHKRKAKVHSPKAPHSP
jgi:hypothetical protein